MDTPKAPMAALAEQTCDFRAARNEMFDFCVRERAGEFDAIFSRVWLGKGAPPLETGLWWCRAERPSSSLSEWSTQIQIMTAENCVWHSGPWKPSFDFQEECPNRAFVFFDGLYPTNDPGPFRFAFYAGCIEVDLPVNDD